MPAAAVARPPAEQLLTPPQQPAAAKALPRPALLSFAGNLQSMQHARVNRDTSFSHGHLL